MYSGARALAKACAVAALLVSSTSHIATAQAPTAPASMAARTARISFGENAISALGSRLPEVAAAWGRSATDLRAELRRDPSLFVDADDNLGYVEPAVDASVVERAPVAPPTPPTESPAPTTAAQAFALSSLPSATRKIFLDFDGNTTSGTAWNTNFTSGAAIVSVPFDQDGNPSNWSAGEIDAIFTIWQSVAEDFAPFDVDVTTIDPGVEGLRKTTSSDTAIGTRLVISPTADFYPNAGGVAYLNSFGGSTETPAFCFTNSLQNWPKYIAECASHEAGHTVGLQHDGVTGGSAYYGGHGNWAPIMGVGYYDPITQWSRGEYANANNTQDDIVQINRYLPTRADDHGDGVPGQSILVPGETRYGVVSWKDDLDTFTVTVASAGSMEIRAAPLHSFADLDIAVRVYNSAGSVIADVTDPGYLDIIVSVSVSPGTYTVLVTNTGEGNPLDTGYSDYASLGEYQLSAVLRPTSGVTLSVVNAGAGLGTVRSNPAGISCGLTCAASFASGSNVTLTPVAAAGSVFTGWSGACTGADACVVPMSQAQAVTANFATGGQLSVLKSGTGSGTVTSDLVGIDCGATCSSTYTTSSTVTLTAVPAADSVFDGWTGACSGPGTCVVSMSGAQTVTATFTQVAFALTVTTSGTGSGRVTSNPVGLDCGATCSAFFAISSSVTLSAVPALGSRFTGWSGACTGTSTSCTVSMTQARAVTATFAPAIVLTVTKAGTGSGTVTSSPAGISCGATCSASYASGTSVRLTAAVATGSRFTGWSGACTGTTTSCTVTMTQARSVTATFTRITYTLSVTRTGTGTGTVTSNPVGISCGSTCSASFGSGTTVTLTATPAAGRRFTGWSGACAGTSTTCTVSMTQSRSVSASFA